MTAEPPGEDTPRWSVPPHDGYTVDDLFPLPDLPPHTELIDGGRVSAADEGLDQTSYAVKDVVLAVEVVSPESQSRDRETKPLTYARAGIPHFWLVERACSDQYPVVHAYELDAVTRTYGLTGIHHDRLKITVPFDIAIDIDISLNALRTL
jgi:Uma2 family endonuclease